jgi:DNA-binding NtrC family response regulator
MAASASETTDGATPPLGRVLLVDDEPELRRLLRRTLVRAGFEVVEAVDGRAALEAVRVAYFDVVISDIRMPRMGGLELMERLQLEEPGMPVVLISGSTELSNRQSALDVGAFDYLAKPSELGRIQSVTLSALAFRHNHVRAPTDGEERMSCEHLLGAVPVGATSGWK